MPEMKNTFLNVCCFEAPEYIGFGVQIKSSKIIEAVAFA
jgi:hypothetical protein